MYVGGTLCCSFVKLNLQMKQISLGLVIGLFPLILQFKSSQGEKKYLGLVDKPELEYIFEYSFHNCISSFHLD